MFPSFLLLGLFLFNFILQSVCHVGQPCNSLIHICLASNSFCDKDNICRCKPEYPVNISLHSCKKGKFYSQKCEYTEECSYYDKNAYCTQLPYRSTCECHNGFMYSEEKKLCVKMGGETPKTTYHVFPAAIGISLATASVACFCLVIWCICKRINFQNVNIPRVPSSRSQYFQAARESPQTVPSAPQVPDETLPTYDIVTLKESDDLDPPPSYEEVIHFEMMERSSKV